MKLIEKNTGNEVFSYLQTYGTIEKLNRISVTLKEIQV